MRTVLCTLLVMALLPSQALAEPASAETDPEGVGWGLTVDTTHARLSGSVDAAARWVDGFFGAERAEVEANFSYLRITPGLAWDDRDGLDTNLRVRGRLHLPVARDRLALFVSGEDDDRVPGITNDAENDSFGPRTAGSEGALGLQFIARRTERLHSSFNATVDSGLHPELSWRLRQRFATGGATDGFASVRPFWHSDDGFGVRLRGQLNHAFGERDLLRLVSSVETFEELEGWRWDASLIYYRQLGERAVLAWALDVQGVTEPRLHSTRYTFGPIFRRNILRPWFFASVRPFVGWERSVDAPTQRIHGALLEFDVVFGATRATRSH